MRRIHKLVSASLTPKITELNSANPLLENDIFPLYADEEDYAYDTD